MNLNILRIAAFSDGEMGGNPAGVWIGDALPDEATMQRIAAEVGYSETVFAASLDVGWRVRYFSPESEVPFCGHATIALGAALALAHGDGVFQLALNNGNITVEGKSQQSLVAAAFCWYTSSVCNCSSKVWVNDKLNTCLVYANPRVGIEASVVAIFMASATNESSGKTL